MKKDFWKGVIVSTIVMMMLFGLGTATTIFNEDDYASEADMISAARAVKDAPVALPTLGTVDISDSCDGDVDADQCIVDWEATFNNKDGTFENVIGNVVVDVVDKTDGALVEQLVHEEVMLHFEHYKASFTPQVMVEYTNNSALNKRYDITTDNLVYKEAIVAVAEK